MELYKATYLEERLINKASDKGIPIFATFELTPFCNFDCEMCFIRMSEQEIAVHGGILDLDFWLLQARKLKEMGTLFILLTGGEPFLYPHFKQLYLSLKKMGFIVTINSNGSCIKSEDIEFLKDNPPRCIGITLYGASNKSYQKTCRNSAGYQKCITTLKKLKDADIAVKLNFTVIKDNLEDFEKIVKLAQELQIPLEPNSYMFPCSRSIRKKTIPEARLSAELASKINAVSRKLQKNDQEYLLIINELIRRVNSTPSLEGTKLSCYAGKASLWITWNGYVTPCVMMEEPSENLLKTNIEECWQRLKQKCLDLPVHEECKGCKLKPICQVCYASATLEKQYKGNLNYLCHFAQEEYNYILNEINRSK